MKKVMLSVVFGLWSVVHWTIKTTIDCVWLVLLLIGKVIALIGSAVSVLLTKDVHGFTDFKDKFKDCNMAVNCVSNIGFMAFIDMLYPFDEES